VDRLLEDGHGLLGRTVRGEEDAPRLDRPGGLLVELLQRLLELGDAGKFGNRIIDALTKAEEMDPSRKEAYLDLAFHYEEHEGNHKLAFDQLEKGLTFYPEDEELLYTGGIAGMKVGGKNGYKLAVDHLRKLKAKNPTYKPDLQQKLDAAESGLQFEGGE
jgi:hypothetical protein